MLVYANRDDVEVKCVACKAPTGVFCAGSGSTPSVHERRTRMAKGARALMTLWDKHNKPHRNCYFMETADGTELCPGEFDKLRDYLKYHGIRFEDKQTKIFGRDLEEPNFWSKGKGSDFPVTESPVGNSGEATEAVLSDPYNELTQATKELREGLEEALQPLTDAITALVDLLERRLRQ